MSKREDIAAHIVSQIGAISEVKSVTREPTDLKQLAVTAFPHVLVETATETREDISFSSDVRREAQMDFLINIVVHGANRDSARNLIISRIEDKLSQDVTMGGLASNSGTSEVLIREIAETAPFGQAAIVWSVKYYYTRGNT